MACRHHILERILAATFTTLFCSTTGPDVTLFKKLQEVWCTLDLTDITLPNIPSYLVGGKEELLAFIDDQLSNDDNLPRGDYKEYLDLAKVIIIYVAAVV